MRTITATELSRNMRQILNQLLIEGQAVIIERNHREVGRLIPGPGRQTAIEAMADLYQTLSSDTGRTWEKDSRRGLGSQQLNRGMRDPWAS